MSGTLECKFFLISSSISWRSSSSWAKNEYWGAVKSFAVLLGDNGGVPELKLGLEKR
jgi:hypothetical protein